MFSHIRVAIHIPRNEDVSHVRTVQQWASSKNEVKKRECVNSHNFITFSANSSVNFVGMKFR